jgi:replicative DNA helicase Mcm
MNPLDFIGSTDLDTAKIAQEYSEKDEPMKAFRSDACGGDVVEGEFALRLAHRNILTNFEELGVSTLDVVGAVYDVYTASSYDVPYRVYDAPRRLISGLSPSDNWGVRTLDARVAYVQQSFEMIQSIEFECNNCGNRDRFKQDIYTTDVDMPSFCPACESAWEGYRVEDSESFIEAQRVIIEDLPENGNDDLVVYLHDDLVGKMVAGSRVEITGVIVPLIEDDSTEVERVMVAMGVEGRDLEQNTSLAEDEQEWCAEELEKGVVDDLVASIAPHILGRDDIKRGILHALVSGANDALKSERTDSHIALIGEPSTGKSVLIHWINEHLHGTELASSEGATGVGLTGAVQRDERLGGEWVLHPGVLSRVNRGVAVVDELDKLSEGDLKRLYSALASGKIDINKATIDATLPSETTLIAAANPENGDFDLHRGPAIDEQFDFPAPLVRRFDLIYPVLRSDVDMNSEYAETQTSRFGLTTSPADKAPYSPEQVAQLVQYARSIDVVLSEQAEKRASEVWQKVQDGAKDGDTQWLDSRRFEGLLRLSLASARLNGREEAIEEDVVEALSLMEDAFGKFVQNGTFDVDLETGRTKTSQEVRKEVKRILSGTVNSDSEVDLLELEEMVSEAVGCDTAVVRGEVAQMDDVFVGDDGRVRLGD